MRTEYCGNVTKEHLGKDVSICGWVHRRRDHGGVIFLDLRDLEGICQAVIDPSNEEAFSLADKCRSEFVIKVKDKKYKKRGIYRILYRFAQIRGRNEVYAFLFLINLCND